MATVRATLAAAAERLRAVTDTPDLEATLLACHAWGWSRTRLIVDAGAECEDDSLEPLLLRRLDAEPIAYILGSWEFFSIPLGVRAPLLVPRPETEHLVEVALEHIGKKPARVLDLCTGTGCVAIALGKNADTPVLWATDCHPVAVAVAGENAAHHEIPLSIVQGDLFAPLPRSSAPFDVIVSNPPYVAQGDWEGLARDIRDYEDPGALLAGADGLDCVRRIVQEGPDWLSPGGLLALEIGEEQGAAVRALLARRGFSDIRVTRDLAGHDRIVSGLWR